MLKTTFSGTSISKMIHFLAVLIFLLPTVTASSDDFWDDVDMICKDLSDAENLPTQAVTSEVQLVTPMPDALQHSPLTDEKEENPSKPQRSSSRVYYPKWVTLHSEDVEKFKEKLIIEDDSQDIPLKLIEDKLLALGRMHEWTDMHTYEVDKYPKYWAKVCAIFWDMPLEKEHSIHCVVSRSYASHKKRKLILRRIKHHLDLLGCRCHTYLSNCKNPLSSSERFLIHKGNVNEFFIFEESESEGKLLIKDFKYGIALPNPSVFERRKNSSAKFKAKLVTLNSHEIQMFNKAISITSNSQNVSSDELNVKLMELEEVHEWPDLLTYDYDKYSRYWAKVCVFFWGKQLDNRHYQACFLSPSLGQNSVHTLIVQDRQLHFDLLWCICHSFVSFVSVPVSKVDTFLIHQSSANEFFVFEQRVTEYYQFTLSIRDFKSGVTLPNPEDFN